MIREFVTSLRMIAVSIVVCAAVYPVFVLVFAALVSPTGRHGSLIVDADGKIRGSALIGQMFARPEYFWPRPSAVDYNASASGGSNLSPANPKLRVRAEKRVAQLSPAAKRKVPADLVTASGSGLDPHITLAAAQFQIPRIAKSRKMWEDDVIAIVNKQVDSSGVHEFFDEAKLLNVLKLNIALDRASNKQSHEP